MFDNVRFEGTINLGAIVVAIIQLISAYTVLIRVRALIEEKNIRLNNPFRKSKPPAGPAGNQEPAPAPADDGTKVPDDKLI